VLIGELEDCAENQSATNVAAECLNALDCIAIVSQGMEDEHVVGGFVFHLF